MSEGFDLERLAMVVSKKQRGLAGVLKELESDCRRYLIGRVDNELIANLADQTKAAKRLALAECDDEMTEGVCWLLIKTLYLKGEIEGNTDRNNFGYEVFQFAATTEKFKFQPLFKYVDTGQKVHSGIDKGNAFRQQDAKDTRQIVLDRFKQLHKDVPKHKLVSEYLRRYKDGPSERTLYRIKKDF